MKILSSLILVATASASAAQLAVPDFTLEAYRGNAKLPLVGVVVKAPAKHHFNVKAPMSAKTVGSSIDLTATTTTDTELRFEVENPSIPAQDSLTVSAYLCDDAKSYCVKKTGSVALASVGTAPVLRNKIVHPEVELPNAKPAASAAAVTVAPVVAATPSATPAAVAFETKPPVAKQKPAKDEHGFWNDANAAQAQARRLNKPLLIDFFGIWCPPCNLYDETVFGTAQFKQQAKNFVLLKVDVDSVDSWTLKSKYKIGGYPTIVFAKSDLEEIDRAVGYFPKDEFTQRMKDAYSHRSTKIEERLVIDKAKYLDGLQNLIELRFEQKDFREAVRFAQEGLLLKPDDPFFKIVKITVDAKDDAKVLKQADTQGFLKNLWDHRSEATASVLLRFQDLLTSNPDAFRPEQILWAADAIDHLKTRVNDKTLQLDGQEMSLADLDALRVDIYEAAKREDLAKQAVKDTISSYRRLMKLFNGEKSRGYNLELAYFLGKDGQVAEATAIYESFIKQYPREFTYYYAAARHYQEVAKDLKRARECADLALKYSYGDNELRAMARVVSVRAAQGEAKEGVQQARQLLAKVPNYQGLSVRTGRYVTALEKAIAAAEGKK